MPALHSVLLIQYNAFHRVFTTVVGTIKCTIGPLHTLHLCIGLHVYSLIIIIIEGGAYGVFKTSACLILWPMRWAPFPGRLLRCYKYKWKNVFFLLNPGDGHNIAKPTNRMPCYSTCMSWLGMGDTYTYIDLCMTCSTLSQAAQQCQF